MPYHIQGYRYFSQADLTPMEKAKKAQKRTFLIQCQGQAMRCVREIQKFKYLCISFHVAFCPKLLLTKDKEKDGQESIPKKGNILVDSKIRPALLNFSKGLSDGEDLEGSGEPNNECLTLPAHSINKNFPRF